MSGLDKKNTFQDRLDRIQRDSSGDGPPKGPGTPRQTRRKSGGGGNGRLIGLGVIGALVLGAFGAGLYGVNHLRNSVDIPLRQIAGKFISTHLAKTPTAAGYDGLQGSGPKERKEFDLGWELPSPYVAAAGRTDLTLDQIATFAQAPALSPAQGENPVSDVRKFALNTACTLRRPQPNEVVYNVRLEHAARYSQTHVFSKAELAKAVGDRIEGQSRGPKHYKNGAVAKGRMGQTDVFVTDTSAPVYLALQTFNSDMVWNIHLAQGVQLAHIAMIGNKSGFAAPAGGYTFEALRVEDFVEDDSLYDNEKLRACMIAPFDRPTPDWRLMQKLDNPVDGSRNRSLLRNRTEGHAAFSQWYTAQLGVDTAHNLSTALRAAHVLAGPVPVSPVEVTPLEGRLLHVTQNDYVVFGDAALVEMHEDLLRVATGADVAHLNAPAETPVSQ